LRCRFILIVEDLVSSDCYSETYSDRNIWSSVLLLLIDKQT
jgi:hypothetical protein